eukprot:scaffold22689_cov163-Cylindrotheca_fusiformis.AAC.3
MSSSTSPTAEEGASSTQNDDPLNTTASSIESNDEESQNDVSFLKAKLNLLQNQLAFLRSQQKQRKDKRKKEKGEIVSTFRSMKSYIDHLEKENKQLTKLAAKNTIESFEESAIGELKEKLALLQKENESLRNSQTELQNKCQELTLQCSSLTLEISDRKDTEAQLREKVEEFEKVVDHIPQMKKKPLLDRHTSTSVLAEASSYASSRDVEDSIMGFGPADDNKGDLFGRVVDHTPNRNFGRGLSARSSTSSNISSSKLHEDDTVLGVTEKAELASIKDFDGEDDSEEDEDAAAGEEWEGSVAADNISLRLDVADTKDLVDHVPSMRSTPKLRARKMDSSIVPLADFSVASKGDVILEGEENGIFGKVVDYTPGFSPVPLKRTPISTLSVSNNNDEDTVLGVTERMEVESVMKQDADIGADAYSEDSEYGDGAGASRSTRDPPSEIGTTISVRLDATEEKHLVDHVPQGRRLRRKQTDASMMVLADASSTSTPVDDNATAEGGKAFGPVVDHTPSIAPVSGKSVATSVATQNSVVSDLNEEQDMDDTVGAGSTIGDADWEGEMSLKDIVVEKHLVDYVPKRRMKSSAIDGSTRAILDSNENMSQVDTIAEDQEMEFGPIVDLTLFSTTRSVASTRSMGLSTANSTRALCGDMRQDDDLDTFPGNALSADTIAEEEDEFEEDDDSHLVDHVPARLHSTNLQIDSSVRVLIDANDNISQGGNTASVEDRSDYGPIVDHTPLSTRSSAPSVAATTAAVGGDDSTTVQDNTVVTEFSMGIGEPIMVPLAGEKKENHVVDHVPTQASRPPVDGSVQVQVDTIETLSQADATSGGGAGVDFGPIVDHTPGICARSVARSVAASLATIGSHHSDSTSIQDNTTVGFGTGASIIGGDDMDGMDDNLALGYGQAVIEKNLVDHVPRLPRDKPGDMSILVQADQLDAVSEVDDENSAGIVRPEKFGPIVDHTPSVPLSSAHSIAMSMLTTASDLAADIQADDDMDATWYSGSAEKERSRDGSSRPERNRKEHETNQSISGRSRKFPGKEDREKRDDEPGTKAEDSTIQMDTATSAISAVMVETVESEESDIETDGAYVRVESAYAGKKFDDAQASATHGSSDGDEAETYDLKEMKEFAEGLAAKATSNRKDNPFEAGVDLSSEPGSRGIVKEEVEDYIAQLASLTAARDSDSDQASNNQKIEEMQRYIAELASGTDSVTGSNADQHSTSGHSADDMQKYLTGFAAFTGVQASSSAVATPTGEDQAGTDSMLPQPDTPTSKRSHDDARHEILDEIGGPKKVSVFGKLFGGSGKKPIDKKDSKNGGTWA